MLPTTLPTRTRPIVKSDGSFRNPWETFEERYFLDVMKWKLTDNRAPAFPSKAEAAARLPSVAPDWDMIRRYQTENRPATGATSPSHVSPLSPPLGRDINNDLKVGRVSVTWCSHSTFLVQSAGFTVLTDPVWSDRASPVSFAGPKRMVPVPIPLASLPTVDVVTISHNHYDHLDAAAVKALRKRFDPIFVVPLGMKRWFSSFCSGVFDLDRVVELNWWDEVEIRFREVQLATGGTCEVVREPYEMPDNPAEPLTTDATLLRVAATPVQHWSMRTGLDRYNELWCGFAIRFSIGASSDSQRSHCTRCVFHCGDTGYCSEFKAIGEILTANGSCTKPYSPDGSANYGVDVALLPVGAYLPRDFMRPQHVDPYDAVLIFDDIRAKYAVGMHWGTFILTDEAIDQPPKDLAVAMQSRAAKQPLLSSASEYERRKRERGDEFIVLRHGETKLYESDDLD